MTAVARHTRLPHRPQVVIPAICVSIKSHVKCVSNEQLKPPRETNSSVRQSDFVVAIVAHMVRMIFAAHAHRLISSLSHSVSDSRVPMAKWIRSPSRGTFRLCANCVPNRNTFDRTIERCVQLYECARNNVLNMCQV